jgi:hypothetical protein
MEMLTVTKGSIRELSLNIPWTRLTSSSTYIVIKNLHLELELRPHEGVTEIPEVSDIEESLIKKVVANLTLELHDLTISLKAPKNGHNYITNFTMDHFKWITTDKNWKPEFVNPYQIQRTNSAFNINKLL